MSSWSEHVLEVGIVVGRSLSVIFLVVALPQRYLRMPHLFGNWKHARNCSVE